MHNEWTDRKKQRDEATQQHEHRHIIEQAKAEVRAEIEAEFSARLDEAYSTISQELDNSKKKFAREKEDLRVGYEAQITALCEKHRKETLASEEIAYQGYAEAYEVIQSLQKRLKEEGKDSSLPVQCSTENAYQIVLEMKAKMDRQSSMFEAYLEEGFEEAYQMLQQQKAEYDSLETVLYDEYEGKLKEMKEFITDKVDQFLRFKWEQLIDAGDNKQAELLDQWRKAVPAAYLVEEAIQTDVKAEGKEIEPKYTPKLQETKTLQEEIDQLKGRLRILEAKNMRLSTQNKMLNETLKETQQIMGLAKSEPNAETAQMVADKRKKILLPPSQVPYNLPVPIQERLIAQRIRKFHESLGNEETCKEDKKMSDTFRSNYRPIEEQDQ